MDLGPEAEKPGSDARSRRCIGCIDYGFSCRVCSVYVAAVCYVSRMVMCSYLKNIELSRVLAGSGRCAAMSVTLTVRIE